VGEGFADLAPRKLPLTPGFAVPSPLGEGRINCSPAASPNVETPAHGESRCEKIVGYRPMRLRRLLCAPSRRGLGRKPTAFRQAAEPKEFNLKPTVRKGRALPHSRRQSRDVFTPSKPWEEGGIYRFTK